MSKDYMSSPRQASSEQTARRPTRRRVRKACEPCRHRKVKCDGGFPCKVCSGYGYECFYQTGEGVPTVVQSPKLKTGASPIVAGANHQDFNITSQELPDIAGPKRRLYVLSDDPQSLKPLNAHFTRVDSAIAFPRSLGLSLNLNNPPRIHSFAWNAGTRGDTGPPARSKVFEYVSLRDVEALSKTYFSNVHPIFGVIDRESFERKATNCWTNQEVDTGFEAVLCSVIALGSFFSKTGSFAYESEVVEQGRLALDSTFAQPKVLLSVDFVAAWVLRAIYLRATAKPHLSWMASNMAMHTAESVGLHQELNDICQGKTAALQSRVADEAECELRRRVYWVSACLNRLFACHYGRTHIMLQNIGCRYPTAREGDETTEFIDLINRAPLDNPAGSSIFSSAELTESLKKLSESPIKPLPLILLRADMSFCIYRKLRYLGVTLSPARVEIFLSMTRVALAAANVLANEGQQWWSVIGVPFHSLCSLIAIGTIESISLLPEAMETLQRVTSIFSSPHATEALQTGTYLLRGAEAKKRREYDLLQKTVALGSSGATAVSQRSAAGGEVINDVMPSFEWPTDLDLGWSEFLTFTDFDGGDVLTNGFVDAGT